MANCFQKELYFPYFNPIKPDHYAWSNHNKGASDIVPIADHLRLACIAAQAVYRGRHYSKSLIKLSKYDFLYSSKKIRPENPRSKRTWASVLFSINNLLCCATSQPAAPLANLPFIINNLPFVIKMTQYRWTSTVFRRTIVTPIRD